MKITTDGTEHIMVMDEQQWSDSDETPQELSLIHIWLDVVGLHKQPGRVFVPQRVADTARVQ